MNYGYIKPTVIKIVKPRLRYRGLPVNKPLIVIGCDMKYLLVADERVVNVHRVLWNDVQLVESERVVQVPIINTNTSKVVNRNKEKKPFFKAGTRPKES